MRRRRNKKKTVKEEEHKISFFKKRHNSNQRSNKRKTPYISALSLLAITCFLSFSAWNISLKAKIDEIPNDPNLFFSELSLKGFLFRGAHVCRGKN